MSYIAEIQGKSPFNVFEDFLTADVFAAFKYIPPHLGLVRFLRTIEGVDALIPEPDKTTVCKYFFWPWSEDSYTEPDLLVEIEHIRGYLLNVFDLDSAEKVKENIVFPLKEAFEKENFDCDFSVPVHAFKKLEKE